MLSLLDMSVAGGAVILAVAAIRALALDRLPKGTFTVLWTVAVLRLLLPVSIPSPVSAYGLANRAVRTVRTAVAVPPAETPAVAIEASPADHQPVTVPAADALAAPAAGSPAEQAAPAGGGIHIPWRETVWAAGALGTGAFFAVGYVRARRRFREAVEVQDDFIRRWQEGHPTRRRVSVCLSGRVSSPMTYGLLRPVVLLPAGTDFHDESALGFILAHEYGHIRRLDGLKKLILAAAVCVHWFNPLVWTMFFLAGRDMEMACDEAVVRSLDGPGRAAYARTLIRMEEVKVGLSPLGSHFSANAMEERITAIMKMKRWTALAVVSCIMLTIGVTAVFAASAPQKTPHIPVPTPTPTPVPEPTPVPMAEVDAAEPVPYDLGEAAVLFPLTEEGLAELFGGVDIRWWEPGAFAAWASAQRPLLEAAVGSPSPETVANGELTWTEERTEAVMAALEQIKAALENGTGKLSRTVAGGGEVVLAVGLDLGLEAGSQGYDMDQLLWCGTDFTGSHTCDVGIGQRLVVLGPSGTEMGLFRLMHAYYDTMVNAGLTDAGTANISLHLHWDAYQHGEMPDQWLVGGEDQAVPEEPELEDLAEGPEPWYVRARPRYVWDLTGEEPAVREEASAETADYLLDIQPYGYRTPVNFDYVGLSGSNFSVHLPPGEESTVDSYDGQIDYLVIARSGGSFELIQRAVNGGEEQAEAYTEKPGGAVARRTGWYVEGGMELAIRNTGTEPLVIDGFIYR